MVYQRTRKSDLVEKLTDSELRDYDTTQLSIEMYGDREKENILSELDAWDMFEDWRYWEEEPEPDPSYLKYVA